MWQPSWLVFWFLWMLKPACTENQHSRDAVIGNSTRFDSTLQWQPCRIADRQSRSLNVAAKLACLLISMDAQTSMDRESAFPETAITIRRFDRILLSQWYLLRCWETIILPNNCYGHTPQPLPPVGYQSIQSFTMRIFSPLSQNFGTLACLSTKSWLPTNDKISIWTKLPRATFQRRVSIRESQPRSIHLV